MMRDREFFMGHDPHPGWRLAEVKLERFKAAFKPRAIPILPFNIVIGRNGSGKSTLLEALQWLDTTIRGDARKASDRYNGTRDLVNLRSPNLFFQLTLTWARAAPGTKLLDLIRSNFVRLRYEVKVEVDERTGTPLIASESLFSLGKGNKLLETFLSTTKPGERSLTPSGKEGSPLSVTVREPDRLAMGLVGSASVGQPRPELSLLQDFWARAVFLRLSPNRLAYGSLATRKSFEPLLDEEGQNLPALLNELSEEQRQNLVRAIQEILPGIRNVEVSSAELGRDTRVNYSLLERMPYRGRAGQREFPIPAWMLSEGTRRITAIMALLVRDPAPSLLCIEEIENGLDPLTVKAVLRHLLSAATRGTQVILTTHSPWVLDDVPIDSILQVRRIKGDTRYERFASRPEIQAFDPSVPAGTRYVAESE
jgi:predicted ATPase